MRYALVEDFKRKACGSFVRMVSSQYEGSVYLTADDEGGFFYISGKNLAAKRINNWRRTSVFAPKLGYMFFKDSLFYPYRLPHRNIKLGITSQNTNNFPRVTNAADMVAICQQLDRIHNKEQTTTKKYRVLSRTYALEDDFLLHRGVKIATKLSDTEFLFRTESDILFHNTALCKLIPNLQPKAELQQNMENYQEDYDV